VAATVQSWIATLPTEYIGARILSLSLSNIIHDGYVPFSIISKNCGWCWFVGGPISPSVLQVSSWNVACYL